MKAFVTGATGKLGSNLVLALLSQGWQVKALARSKDKAQKILGNTHAEIVIGDMENVAGFAPALQGVDVVFHTAAYFREYFDVGDHWKTLQKINIDAVIELMNEAQANGVKKFIHTSSSGVLGGKGKGHASDESTTPGKTAHDNMYFKSKVRCEQAINEWLQTNTMPVIMILPTVMIGPRDSGPTAIGEAILQISKGKFPAVPPGGFEFVDSRDVALAMIAAADKGKSGERYITSESFHTMNEMAQSVAIAAKARKPMLRLTPIMAYAVAYMSEFAARLTGSKPMLPVAGVQAMVNEQHVSAAKAVRELGFKARPFSVSITDEVAWYREAGYLG